MSIEYKVPCTCEVRGPKAPPRPAHTEDTLFLKDEVDPVLGIAVIRAAAEAGTNQADVLGAIAGAYLANGIESWTFTDSDGALVEISRRTVNRLIRWPVSAAVANRLAELHSEVIFRPLVEESSTPSDDGTTDGSISPIPESGSETESLKWDSLSSPNGTDGSRSEVPVG